MNYVFKEGFEHKVKGKYQKADWDEDGNKRLEKTLQHRGKRFNIFKNTNEVTWLSDTPHIMEISLEKEEVEKEVEGGIYMHT